MVSYDYSFTCSIPKDIAQLNLNVEKAPRQDIMFMKKVFHSNFSSFLVSLVIFLSCLF